MNGEIKKIDTKTAFNGPGGYPAWHPSGELIAFSVGKPMQFFHTIGETRDELDRSLDIIVYDIKSNTVTTVSEISSPDRIEVWPVWTPDGQYLYFCSAPKLETFYIKSQLGEDSLAYDKIKYDLMRISYDLSTHTWGKLETVISSAEIGLSISQPKISPDGRFLIYTASRYGSFPIFHSDADLYLLDLKSGRQERLALNSDRADGYHSWSSNSRWIIFSSKRQDTQFTQLYLSHMDSSGNSTKAFLLPQEQPDFYQKHLEVFNVPEFTKEPIRVSPRELAKAVFSNALAAKLDQKIILNKNIDKAKSAAQVKTP
jgi:Tol biopolymer transport system component